MSSAKVQLVINGRRQTVEAEATETLVDTIRDRLHLTGTHIGCQSARCGACLVEMDGQSVKACTVLTHQADGADIRTIEGLAPGPDLDAIQTAFRTHHALQCGFCTPGMVMAAREILRAHKQPTEAQIREGLKGNLCRCTGYQNIIRAIQAVAEDAAPIAKTGPSGSGIGAAHPRTEDARFLKGEGRYCGDINLPAQVHAAFARSNVPHARIVELDIRAAQNLPGVVAVLTGEDVAADGLGELRCGWQVYSRDGAPMAGGARAILAKDKVRFVGDAYAVVLAERPEIAKRAAALIQVQFEPLAHNVRTAAAGEADPIFQDAQENVCFDWLFGDEQGADRALETAAHVTTVSLTNNRVIPNALEPRAAIADFNQFAETATLYTTSQNPHMARKVIAETLGVISEHNLRVISPDLGGGFGSKIFIYPEECACLWASKRLGRPVKWVGTREEAFLADAHGRDHVSRVQLALDEDHRFVALKVETTANLGAYLSSFAAFVPTYLYGTMLAGPYKTPTISCAVKGVFTNTAPVDAYRGAGRPEATYLIETVIDTAARECGLDPVELRRLNLIQPTDFPYQTPVALEYDVGDYQAHLDRALSVADYSGFETRRAEAQARGKRRGIGVSLYVEACGIAPSAVAGALGADVGLWESALLRFTPTGMLQVFTGSHSHGQGHETTFAQLVADRFALPLDQIRVLHGDTDQTPVGMGTYGSRSLAVGGSAILKAADKIISKGKQIAAHLLDTVPEAIDFSDGVFLDAARNAHVPLREVVHAAYVPHDYPEDLEPGLEASAFYDPVNFTYPSGTHVCELELDPHTGEIEIISFVAVDDFGQIVNPLIVEGQVQGGIAQGIGQALIEHGRYDAETGQPMTTSYRAYAMPRASDLINVQTETVFTACENNPVGAKGCGESGTIGAPPAVMNAVSNALGQRIEMPATAEKIFEACARFRAKGGHD